MGQTGNDAMGRNALRPTNYRLKNWERDANSDVLVLIGQLTALAMLDERMFTWYLALVDTGDRRVDDSCSLFRNPETPRIQWKLFGRGHMAVPTA